MRIFLVGGGTGGHLYPLVAVARELKTLTRDRQIELELAAAGPADSDQEVLGKEGVTFFKITSGKFRRYPSIHNVLDIFRFIRGLIEALRLLWLEMPDVVFSKGGYGSLPVVMAAWLYRIPLVVHESDSVAGLVTRFSIRFARLVLLSFKETQGKFPQDHTVVVGHPVRTELFGINRDAARSTLGLQTFMPMVLVLGGSQGALEINRMLIESLKRLCERVEIVHQCGTANLDWVRNDVRSRYHGALDNNYHVYGFFTEQELAAALAACDLVVARAGAGSIFEIAAAGKPAILIPLGNAASGHQRENAYAFAKAGAAYVLEGENLSPALLTDRVFHQLDSPEETATMARHSKAFSRPDAARLVALELMRLASA